MPHTSPVDAGTVVGVVESGFEAGAEVALGKAGLWAAEAGVGSC